MMTNGQIISLILALSKLDKDTQAKIEKIEQKSDQTYVDNAIKRKADQDYVDNAIKKKADQDYVDNAIKKKADQDYVDNAIEKKADQNYVDDAIEKKADQDYVDDIIKKKATVQSVNGKTGTVELKAKDIKSEDNKTVEQILNGITANWGIDDIVITSTAPTANTAKEKTLYFVYE